MKCVNVFDCESQTEPSENWPVSSFHELLLFAQIFAHSGGSLPPGWSLQTLDRLNLDGVDGTSEGVCFTYASIDKRSWEALWLKTIVIVRSHAADYRSFYHHAHHSSQPYADLDHRGLTCVIFTRSRAGNVVGGATPNTQSTMETRRIVTFGDVLALLLHNSSPASPPMITSSSAISREQAAAASIMDLNLKTPEPYANPTNAQNSNYACPPTPVLPDGPNLDYLPPSLPPPAPGAMVHENDTRSHEEDGQMEDDVISIDESNRGLVIDESTHDDVPPSPTDSRRSSPELPSPLAGDDDDRRRESTYQEEGADIDTVQTHEAVKSTSTHVAASSAISAGAALEKLKSSQHQRGTVVATSTTCAENPTPQKDGKITEPTRLFCEICQKTFAWKKSFDHHMKVHSGVREFQCPQSDCSRTFALKKQLVRHLKGQHKAKGEFACHSCDKKFVLEADLQTHSETHGPKKIIKCPYEASTGCDKTYPSKSLLIIHMRVHTGEKPFKCHLCPKAYQQNQHLKEHLYTHSGELPFLCELCSKGFKSQAQLTLHLRMHANDRRFVCHVQGCDKSYVTKALLTKHVKTVHLGERPYLCPYCDKSYPKVYDLKNHIRSHTGERPFQCDVCFKDFAHKVVWRRHMALHETNKDKDESERNKNGTVEDRGNDGGGDPSIADDRTMVEPEMERNAREEERLHVAEDSHMQYVYDTQWRRQEIYAAAQQQNLDHDPRLQHVVSHEPMVVDATTGHSDSHVDDDQTKYQIVSMNDNHEERSQPRDDFQLAEDGAHHPQPSLPPPQQQQPPQIPPPPQPQQHYHQHPKYRFLRKESAYSPSTLSAYSETNNVDNSVSTDGAGVPTERYTPPPHPPLPHSSQRNDSESHSAGRDPESSISVPPPLPPASSPTPLHQSPFALAKLRGVSLSHALPLPTTPSHHHALSLSAHPAAIHGLPGYGHPFNYSLCSTLFPPFHQAAPTGEDPAGPGNGNGGTVYPSFVPKNPHSL